MERTHDENRCVNCAKSAGVHTDAFTGLPVCFSTGAEDGDIVCTNFKDREDT